MLKGGKGEGFIKCKMPKNIVFCEVRMEWELMADDGDFFEGF